MGMKSLKRGLFAASALSIVLMISILGAVLLYARLLGTDDLAI